jgi:hypothetical protein
MFAHKLVPHLSSQRALARMGKPLSFHTIMGLAKVLLVKKLAILKWLHLTFSVPQSIESSGRVLLPSSRVYRVQRAGGPQG